MATVAEADQHRREEGKEGQGEREGKCPARVGGCRLDPGPEAALSVEVPVAEAPEELRGGGGIGDDLVVLGEA